MAYVATIIALEKGISAEFTEKFETLLRAEGVTILRLETLSEDKVVDYYLDFEEIQFNEIKARFHEFSDEQGVDIILQRANENRKAKGLFVFDMDSTLIQQEVIDMIAAYANVEAEVSVSAYRFYICAGYWLFSYSPLTRVCRKLLKLP